ncbi:MAG: S-adenosylmethionine:tRNA ribosyltransferase-isomerase, partial [Planctomycetota bacterium]|nr:S-adenosylmethionine:tRNA ribosyltransferase-isomerase [Planctomycetota bacterium]
MAKTDDYDYKLPPDLIAQYPLRQRSDARLLVVDRSQNSWEHHHVRDLPTLLSSGDCLVVNRTRVIPARLVGSRADTGGRWEGLYLGSDADGNWRIVFRTRGQVQSGCRIVLRDSDGRDRMVLVILAKLGDGEWAARPEGAQADPMRQLQDVGHVPLPHYIRDGQMVDFDRESYQTVYGDQLGSVAAPTAGLHFTKSLLQSCSKAGIDLATLTLHVGIGTFRPVKVPNLEEHVMHAERGELNERCVERLQLARSAGRRIVAVGTTTVRVLETAAHQPGGLAPWSGETRLFIRPPYEFRA